MSKTKKLTEEKSIRASLVQLYLCSIMLFLPVIVTDGYYNITETKSVCFYILSLVMTVPVFFFFLSDAIKRKNIKTDFLPTDIAVLIFGAVSFLSAVISEYQSDVWFGNNSRYQGTVTILLYIAVYFAVSRNYLFRTNFLLCSLAAFSLVCVIGVLNCFDIDVLGFYGTLASKYKEAYISTIGNINFYSAYLCLLFPLIVCGFCQTAGRTSRVIYTSALVVGAFGIMVTSSESFVVGFVLSMLIIPMFFGKDSEKLKKYIESVFIVTVSMQVFLVIYRFTGKKNIEISQLLSFITSPAVTAVIVLLSAVAYYLVVRKPQGLTLYRRVYFILISVGFITGIVCLLISNTAGLGFLDKYLKITDSWGTYRGEIWKQCIDVYERFSLKEKCFGTGPEALYKVVKTSDVHGDRILDQAHNEYLQFLLTTGLLGLLSYLSVIITVTVSVIRRLRDNALAVGLMSGLISYWVQASVNIAQPFTTPIMYVFIACIVGMLYNKAFISDNAE